MAFGWGAERTADQSLETRFWLLPLMQSSPGTSSSHFVPFPFLEWLFICWACTLCASSFLESCGTQGRWNSQANLSTSFLGLDFLSAWFVRSKMQVDCGLSELVDWVQATKYGLGPSKFQLQDRAGRSPRVSGFSLPPGILHGVKVTSDLAFLGWNDLWLASLWSHSCKCQPNISLLFLELQKDCWADRRWGWRKSRELVLLWGQATVHPLSPIICWSERTLMTSHKDFHLYFLFF